MYPTPRMDLMRSTPAVLVAEFSAQVADVHVDAAIHRQRIAVEDRLEELLAVYDMSGRSQ